MSDYVVTYSDPDSRRIVSDRVRSKRSAAAAARVALQREPLAAMLERDELALDDACRVTTTTTEHEIRFEEIVEESKE